jgi:ankyrin repeat protein
MNTRVFYFAMLVSLVFGSLSGKKKQTFKSSRKFQVGGAKALSSRPEKVHKVKTTESLSLSLTPSPSQSSSPSFESLQVPTLSYSTSSSNFDLSQSNFSDGISGEEVDAVDFIDFDRSEDALISVEEEAPGDQSVAETANDEQNNKTDDFFESFIQKFMNSNDPEISDDLEISWDIEFEGQWCLRAVEFRQLLAVSYFSPFLPFVNIPASSEEKGKAFQGIFLVDLNWPEMESTAFHPSVMSNRFQLFALIALTKNNRSKVFRSLLAADVIDLERPIFNKSTGVYKSFLSHAIDLENPNMEKIELLLQNMPQHMINKPDSNGTTPLELAIMKNDLDLVKKLVEAGADPNISTDPAKSKYTPFMLAIHDKNCKMIELLIETGKVDFTVSLQDNVSVLSLAAINLNSYLIQKLLIATAHSSNFKASEIGKVLHHLLKNSRPIFQVLVTEILKTKLSKLVSITLCLTMVSLFCNDIATIQYLKTLNVPMNTILTSEEYTRYRFIHVAAERGQIEMVKFFISLGISPFVLTGANKTVLSVAYMAKQYLVVEELLKLVNAHPGLFDCLEHAFSVEDIQMIDLLLGSSLDLDKLTFPSGHNLITKAIAMNKSLVLQRLINSGKLNLYQPDQLGQTIHTISIPHDASDHIKSLVITEINSANDLFVDFC